MYWGCRPTAILDGTRITTPGKLFRWVYIYTTPNAWRNWKVLAAWKPGYRYSISPFQASLTLSPPLPHKHAACIGSRFSLPCRCTSISALFTVQSYRGCHDKAQSLIHSGILTLDPHFQRNEEIKLFVTVADYNDAQSCQHPASITVTEVSLSCSRRFLGSHWFFLAPSSFRLCSAGCCGSTCRWQAFTQL